jgi:hypothetical protein
MMHSWSREKTPLLKKRVQALEALPLKRCVGKNPEGIGYFVILPSEHEKNEELQEKTKNFKKNHEKTNLSEFIEPGR